MCINPQKALKLTINYTNFHNFFSLQELNKRQSQLENAHSMLMRHHEQTHELETKQQRSVHFLREDHLNRQHSTELSNQEEYMKRAQRELKKKHALEIKQQPKSLKQKELMIRKQVRIKNRVSFDMEMIKLPPITQV